MAAAIWMSSPSHRQTHRGSAFSYAQREDVPMSDQAPPNEPAPRVSFDDEPPSSARKSGHALSRPGDYVSAPLMAPGARDQAKAARAVRARQRSEPGTRG